MLANLPINPTIKGGSFSGWSTQVSGGTIFDFSNPIIESGTFYAQYDCDIENGYTGYN